MAISVCARRGDAEDGVVNPSNRFTISSARAASPGFNQRRFVLGSEVQSRVGLGKNWIGMEWGDVNKLGKVGEEVRRDVKAGEAEGRRESL